MRVTIKNATTKIHNRKQIVVLEYGDSDAILITPQVVYKQTSLKITEVELLIGSYINLHYYEKYEAMPNGQFCQINDTVVKTYRLILQKPIEVLRIENKNQLLPFKEISYLQIERVNDEMYVRIYPTNGEDVYISIGMFKEISSLNENEFHILGIGDAENHKGSYFLPIYHNKEDMIANKNIDTNINIIKSIHLRYYDTFEKMTANMIEGDRSSRMAEYIESWAERPSFEEWEIQQEYMLKKSEDELLANIEIHYGVCLDDIEE